jgi:hypothetical protein
MYWDNFLKLLLMFPIIVLIIEAGRVFAFVTGPASGGGLIALFIVMVGFFGPLFILPKTFRWGGTLMAMTGGAMERAGGSLGKPGREYLEWRKGLSRWSQARALRRAEIERRARLGFARGLNVGGVRGKIARARLYGLTTPGRNREIVGAITSTAEERLREEEIKTEALAIEREVGNKARSDQLRILETEAQDANITEHRRQALISRMAQLQGGEQLTRVRDFMLTHGRGEEWNRAVNRNFDSLKITSPHLAQGATEAMMAENNGRGRTFTVDEDLSAYLNQSDQFISTMSGDGWAHFNRIAPEEAKSRYMRIMTSGQPYAANVSPAAHRIFDGPPRVIPGLGAGVTAEGVINVPHESPSAEVINADDVAIQSMVRKAGGWDKLSNSDLLRIYRYRTGGLKESAEQELKKRGLFP